VSAPVELARKRAQLAAQTGEAPGRHSERSGVPAPGGAVAFLTDAELGRLPPIEHDIDGVLPTGGLNFLVGPQGSGKTLLALEWSISIALGRPWYGRDVRQGPVVYIAAEGARSLNTRLDCWKFYHKVSMTQETGIRWLPKRVALADHASVTAFISAAMLAAPPPRMVVIDTFPRCTQGLAENDADGMGRALDAADRIRETLGSSVLLVTHPSREGSDNPRGHSSQESAADAVWALKEQDGVRVLSCPKLKDGDESQTISLVLVQCGNSVLLLPPEAAASSASLTPGQRTVLATIRDTDVGNGLPAGTIIDASRLPKSTVYFVLKHLHDAGFVSATRHRWSLTPSGVVQLSSGVSSEKSSAVPSAF
jgi:AAA domain-containing protein